MRLEQDSELYSEWDSELGLEKNCCISCSELRLEWGGGEEGWEVAM